MEEKNFAKMSIEELEKYCEEKRKELDIGLWQLKYRKAKAAKKTKKKGR